MDRCLRLTRLWLLLPVRDRLFVLVRLNLSRYLLPLRVRVLLLVLRRRLLLLNERFGDLLRFLPFSGISERLVVEDERLVDEVDDDEELLDEVDVDREREREPDELEELRAERFDDKDFERTALLLRFLKLELLSRNFSLPSASFFSFDLSFFT